LHSGKRKLRILPGTRAESAFQEVLPADKNRKAPFFMPRQPVAAGFTKPKAAPAKNLYAHAKTT